MSLACLFALLAAVAGSGTGPASAKGTIEYLGEELDLAVNNPFTQLCLGDKRGLLVSVEKYGVYRDPDTFFNVLRVLTGLPPSPDRVQRDTLGLVQINEEVSNPSALDVSVSHLVLNNFDMNAVYDISAKKVGTIDITFTATEAGAVGSSQKITVKVTECDYKVHVFSIWHISAGRNLVASSSIDTVIEYQGPSTLGAEYFRNVHAIVENDVVTFTPPCQAHYKLPNTEAEVVAYLDDGILDVSVVYDLLDVDTAVTCGLSTGANADKISLDQIDFVLDGGGGSDSGAHVGHSGLGDFTGTTYITVTPIPK